MNSKELSDKAKKISFWAKRISNTFSSGEFLSLFHGHGMEYEESRKYAFGDDMRRIDWKVTARSDQAYVKVFREEREINFLILLDVSRSMCFGVGERTKLDVASELAALMALVAEKRGDRVGVLVFSDQLHYLEAPKKGKSHVRSMVEHILAQRSSGYKTSISFGLEKSMSVLSRRSFVLLISDFQDQNYESQLVRIARSHDLVTARIVDGGKSQVDISKIGLQSIDLESLTTGKVETDYEDATEFESWKKMMVAYGANPFFLSTVEQTDQALHRFMLRRRQKWKA